MLFLKIFFYTDFSILKIADIIHFIKVVSMAVFIPGRHQPLATYDATWTNLATFHLLEPTM